VQQINLESVFLTAEYIDKSLIGMSMQLRDEFMTDIIMRNIIRRCFSTDFCFIIVAECVYMLDFVDVTITNILRTLV